MATPKSYQYLKVSKMMKGKKKTWNETEKKYQVGRRRTKEIGLQKSRYKQLCPSLLTKQTKI